MLAISIIDQFLPWSYIQWLSGNFESYPSYHELPHHHVQLCVAKSLKVCNTQTAKLNEGASLRIDTIIKEATLRIFMPLASDIGISYKDMILE